MKRIIGASVSLVAAIAVVAIAYESDEKLAEASDHDDHNPDLSGRALNLTDHFAFKSPGTPTEMSLIMYFNPRSLPSVDYFLSPNARYEFHVARVGAQNEAAKVAEDLVFRFEAGPPNASNVQAVTLTVLRRENGELVVKGSMTGNTTNVTDSKAGGSRLTTNNGSVDGLTLKWFIGQRADSFHFDVIRFFQVRAFLAQRFFGGPGGTGDNEAPLAPNCRGDLALVPLLSDCEPGQPCASEGTGTADHDLVNLFNPPSCAPDFTKNLNVTAIVLNVPIDQLGGQRIFDTWSTISVLQ